MTDLRLANKQVLNADPANAAPLQVRCFNDLAALGSLRGAWEELLARVPTASVFSTWEWLAPWWRAYGSGRELVVLAFYDPAGTLVGLAPLSRVERRVAPAVRLRVLEFMGDGSEDSDNLDILAVPGCEPRVVRALLNYFRENDSGWDVIQLNLFPSYSPAAAELKKQFQALQWTVFPHTHPWCVLHLPETWDAYLQQISRKERDKIRYYERRLNRLCQARFYKCSTVSELPACLQALFDLHQMRWILRGEPGSFAWKARRDFYLDLSRTLLERGQLEFYLLDINSKPAAAQYGFRYRDTVYLLQQGFDVQYAQLSVQDVLHAHVFQQLIPAGVRRYDFLGGVSLRKKRWGSQVGNYVHLHSARPFSRGSLYLQTVRNAGLGKQWLRSHLPAPAWAMLKRFTVFQGKARNDAEEPEAETSQTTADEKSGPAKR